MSRSRRILILVRVLVAVTIVAALALTAGGAWYWRVSRSCLPQTSGTIRLPGLRAAVGVRRDARGIPHLSADSPEDLFFAQGFVSAQDRLFQMDLLRRDALGELSEIVGVDAVGRDVRHRRLGYRQVCERAYEKLSGEPKLAVDRFSEGVSAYIAAQDGVLPFEFRLLRYEPRPWTPIDSMAIGKLMAEQLNTTYETDLLRAEFADLGPELHGDLFPDHSTYDVPLVGVDPTPQQAEPDEADAPAGKPNSMTDPVSTGNPFKPAAFTPDPGDASREASFEPFVVGSNNWVVDGTRSTSRKPILANDPHLPLALPPIWYAMHLSVRDGSFDVAGVTFPGAPGIVIGHNRRIAWGVTNFGPDVQDLFVEEFDEAGTRYRVGDAWENATIRQDVVRVRKPGFTTEYDEWPIELVSTRHGPIVKDSGATKYALRWTALDDASEMPAFLYLNRAGSWDEFTAGLRHYPGPMQSFVYADVDGNIGYYGAGNVPVRPAGKGDVPVPGASGGADWTGYVPFESLPNSKNPPTGFLVSANNRIVGDSVTEFYTKMWMSPFRARRIGDLLRPATRLTVDDMNRFQNDTYSYPDAIFAAEAVRLAEARIAAGDPEAGTWTSMVSYLGGWDGHLNVDSVSATIAVRMRRQFVDRVLKAKLGDRAARYAYYGRDTFVVNLVEKRPARWLPEGAADWESVFLESFVATREALHKEFGPNPSSWKYGRINTLTLAHPLGRIPRLAGLLNLPTMELDGGPATVKAMGVVSGAGPSMRFVVDLEDFDRATLVLPSGNSGQHASDHYDDQTDDWRVGRTAALPFSEAAVAAATVATLRLEPAP